MQLTDITAPDCMGVCVCLQLTDIVQLLLEHGANADIAGQFIYAPSMNHIAIASLLLEKDADVNAVSHNGKTPMNLLYWPDILLAEAHRLLKSMDSARHHRNMHTKMFKLRWLTFWKPRFLKQE